MLKKSGNPGTVTALEATVRDARRAVRRRAALSAGMSLVPVPGIDVAVDAAALLNMMRTINAMFQLSPEQIGRLDVERRLATMRAVDMTGALFAGRFLTQGLVLSVLKQLGFRWAASRAAKWAPVAGQTAAAALSYAIFLKLGEQHIAECVAVRERVVALLAHETTL